MSFYNQTGDTPIHPTPVVGVLGIIDDVSRRVPSGWQDPGHNIYLLGTTATELDGSAWADVVPLSTSAGGLRRSTSMPRSASPVCSRLRTTSGSSPVRTTCRPAASHRRSPTACCASASARASGFTEIMERDGVDAATALFSESTGRVIVSVPREDDVKFRGLCTGRGYPVARIGVTDSVADLEVQDVFTYSADELRELSSATLQKHFGETVAEPVA